MDRKIDAYARLPSAMEIIERPRVHIVRTTGQTVEVSDEGRCFICARHMDEEDRHVCPRCGFTYCGEHAGDEYHKCGLPKHKNSTDKELRLLALDMRRLMGAEFIYERKIERDVERA